jgi:hypothetical protein
MITLAGMYKVKSSQQADIAAAIALSRTIEE